MQSKKLYNKKVKIKNEHTGNRTLVLGHEIPCTTTMLCAQTDLYHSH